MIQAPPRTIIEVFESLPEGTLCQIINNRLIMSPAPTSAHHRVSKALFRQLDRYAESNGSGEAFFAPFDVYFDEENVYQPDVFFITTDRLFIVEDNVYGAPDLIIEVLSPGTEKIDKIEKKKVYEKCGVKEYWIVHPLTKKTIGYKLTNKVFMSVAANDGEIVSSLLGLTLQF